MPNALGRIVFRTSRCLKWHSVSSILQTLLWNLVKRTATSGFIVCWLCMTKPIGLFADINALFLSSFQNPFPPPSINKCLSLRIVGSTWNSTMLKQVHNAKYRINASMFSANIWYIFEVFRFWRTYKSFLFEMGFDHIILFLIFRKFNDTFSTTVVILQLMSR
jgi:hypothetical protein